MRVRELFLRNLSAKLLSLFFALILWGVVIGEKKAQIQLNLPLELVNIPPKTVVVSDVPPSISVVVQGPRTLLRTLPDRGIRKSIDLSDMGFGWTTIRILPDSISLPRGIEIIRVSPATVDLKLDPLVEVRLPVIPQLVGEPPKGYRVVDVQVDPPRVLLKGGESELSALTEVRTQSVTLNQVTTDLEERVGLDLEGLHLVDTSPLSVWVRVRVAPVQVQRTLKGIRVRVIGSEREVRLSPHSVEVRLKGPQEVMKGLDRMDVKAVVDLKGLAEGTHQVPVRIQAPEGIRVLEAIPPVIRVTVRPPRSG